MEEKKRIVFSIGYMTNGNVSLEHLDISARAISSLRNFHLKITERNIGEPFNTEEFSMRVNIGKAYGGLNSFMDYIMDTLNEPIIFTLSNGGETITLDYEDLYQWLFRALQGLLL